MRRGGKRKAAMGPSLGGRKGKGKSAIKSPLLFSGKRKAY